MSSKFTSCLLISLIAAAPVYATDPGDQAPHCQASDINNNQLINIPGQRNKIIYLDFWASWCPPCKKSFPTLNKLHQELKEHDFEVIAVNLDENKDDALGFLQDNPVTFSIAYDGEGACPETYQVMAMPSSYIIDKNGIVRKVHLGFNDGSEEEIRSTILSLIK